MNFNQTIRTTLSSLIVLLTAVIYAQPVTDRLNQQKEFINENLYVSGAACIGGDCVNLETIPIAALRLKQNNIAIEFDDTSTGVSFAKNDWSIKVNDSFTGGLNYFQINDVTGSATPFHIEAGADNNALYVDMDGQVGIGTDNPEKSLHIIGDGIITGEFEVLSDRKLKKNITNIQDATATLALLRAVAYEMKSEEYPDLKLPAEKQYGLIAQEVNGVLPELVTEINAPETGMPENRLQTVNYLQLIPILIRANQEQSQEIAELKEMVQQLSEKIK